MLQLWKARCDFLCDLSGCCNQRQQSPMSVSIILNKHGQGRKEQRDSVPEAVQENTVLLLKQCPFRIMEAWGFYLEIYTYLYIHGRLYVYFTFIYIIYVYIMCILHICMYIYTCMHVHTHIRKHVRVGVFLNMHS